VPNTKDDGFTSVQEAIQKSGMDPALADKISVSDRQFVRVVSIGENAGVQMGVWAVFEVGQKKVCRSTGAKSRCSNRNHLYRNTIIYFLLRVLAVYIWGTGMKQEQR
jgi:hypothetical protein